MMYRCSATHGTILIDNEMVVFVLSPHNMFFSVCLFVCLPVPLSVCLNVVVNVFLHIRKVEQLEDTK